MLDLGCGNGKFADYLRKSYCNVTAIDNNETNLKEAMRRNGGINYIYEDITRFKTDEKYDTILLLGVLDNLVGVDPSKFLKSLKGMLKTSGRIILQVANSVSLQNRLKSLLGHIPPEADIPHWDFTKKGIEEIVMGAGLEIELFTTTKLWSWRTHRWFMPIDTLATEFLLVIR